MVEHGHDHAHQSPGYGGYLLVWFALVVLTGITVVVAGIQLHALTVPVALAIASIKTMLVVLYFMHIKYEPTLFKLMLLVCFITFVIFIGLTFSDFAFRPA
jgi:cytochrome c oxidase subunit 4